MKKEELEATSLVELRIIAKGKGLKNVTALRKAELIDLLLSVEEKEEKVIPENETPAVETPVNEEWNEELKQSIIVGDFKTAVSTCFKYHQYADAFVIAAWGGADLIEKTTVRTRMND